MTPKKCPMICCISVQLKGRCHENILLATKIKISKNYFTLSIREIQLYKINKHFQNIGVQEPSFGGQGGQKMGRQLENRQPYDCLHMRRN